MDPQDAIKGGLAQHITSHSIRKAGAVIALAAGVSQANIRRGRVRWLDPQMIWQYAPNDYTVSEDWHDVFSWKSGVIGFLVQGGVGCM